MGPAPLRAVPWDVVERAAPDVLSFDLTRVAWGVVAPHRPEADVEVAGLLDAAIARTGVAGTKSVLTPTCGTGRMAPRREVAVSAALGELARARRRRAM